MTERGITVNVEGATLLHTGGGTPASVHPGAPLGMHCNPAAVQQHERHPFAKHAPTGTGAPPGSTHTPASEKHPGLLAHEVVPSGRHTQLVQRSREIQVVPTANSVPSGARHTGGGSPASKQSLRRAHVSEALMSQKHSVHPSGERQLAPTSTGVPSGAEHIGGGGTTTSSGHARAVHARNPPAPHEHELQPSKKLSPTASTRPPGSTQPPPSGSVASGRDSPPSPGRTYAPHAGSSHAAITTIHVALPPCLIAHSPAEVERIAQHVSSRAHEVSHISHHPANSAETIGQ
jgi:hypothetical protein